MALTKVNLGGVSDQAINESKLQVSNSPTNGLFLSAQSGNTGGLTWAAASAGKVLQIVQAVKDDTFSSNAASFTDITGLTLNITPSATSSKILLTSVFTVSNDNNYASTFPYFRFMRGSTAIGIGASAGNRQRMMASAGNNSNTMQSVAMHFLDSPSSTSAVTYKVQLYNQQTARITYIGRSGNDSDNTSYGRSSSILTAMEIAG